MSFAFVFDYDRMSAYSIPVKGKNDGARLEIMNKPSMDDFSCYGGYKEIYNLLFYKEVRKNGCKSFCVEWGFVSWPWCYK